MARRVMGGRLASHVSRSLSAFTFPCREYSIESDEACGESRWACKHVSAGGGCIARDELPPSLFLVRVFIATDKMF